VGTIAGAMVGRHIGETMDEADRMQTAAALSAARTGEATTWVNPDNGNRYTVTPTGTFEQSGGPCREFRLDAKIGDQPDQEVYGTACLQADGSWLVR
jgi:surface antigen